MDTSSRDNEITVDSTSRNSAQVSPITLNETEQIKSSFHPIIVNNPSAPDMSVKGNLIYEKKRKADEQFPTDRLTRKSAKAGEWIEISLDTTETYKLFDGIRELYALHSVHGIPSGTETYARIDADAHDLLEILRNNPDLSQLVDESENLDLVIQILNLITGDSSSDSLQQALLVLEETKLDRLNCLLNINALQKLLETLEQSLGNNSEEYWQSLLKENSWILSQLFASPCTILKDKVYVGGKGIDNKGGHVVDFVYQNKLTRNVALIEIKTPTTEIMGAKYRNGAHSLGGEICGAVSQVNKYRDSLMKEYSHLAQNSQGEFRAFLPKCYIIAGNLSSLNQGQINDFENFRGCLSGIEIITFDELVERINGLLLVLLGELPCDPELRDANASYYDDEDAPF